MQIFNADDTELYASVMTIPTTRREATGNTVLTLAQQGQSTPAALLKWFYPGHEFVYPKAEQQQLAQDRQHNVVANAPVESGD